MPAASCHSHPCSSVFDHVTMSKQAAGLDYTVIYTLNRTAESLFANDILFFTIFVSFLTGCLQKILHAQKYSFLIISAKMP